MINLSIPPDKVLPSTHGKILSFPPDKGGKGGYVNFSLTKNEGEKMGLRQLYTYKKMGSKGGGI